jgi:hypothetical protein
MAINATEAESNLSNNAIVNGLFTPARWKSLKTSTTIAGWIAGLIL